MHPTALLIALTVTAQVPPPTSSGRVAEPFRRQHREIVGREVARISALADTLKASGKADPANEVRRALAAGSSPGGASRFVPVPEIEPARGDRPKAASLLVAGQDGDAWRLELQAIQATSAKEFFDLARRAAASQPTKQLALADACLREVIAREPDHAEARRLLGHVSFNGGWATPFAVEQMKGGKTLHPVFGWVPRGWVPHLEKGELPGWVGSTTGRETWFPAAESDALHRAWANGWTIRTEHFQIKTNVPLNEAIVFGRNLEAFHDLFEALFADVIGDTLSLARRFKDPAMTGERPSEAHSISYFADRDDYVATLRPIKGDIDRSIGFYRPPKPNSSRSKRGHAYFFRDPDGDIDVTSTLYHEVSHMLLFESGVAPTSAYEKNAGNFWVFEGLGTYFETTTINRDGTVSVGGRVGPRIEEARKNLINRFKITPLDRFVRLDEARFNDEAGIFQRYQQATALAIYLMQGEGGKYRDDFLAYVKDACQGRLKRTSGQSLEARLGIAYPALEDAFLANLNVGQAK